MTGSRIMGWVAAGVVMLTIGIALYQVYHLGRIHGMRATTFQLVVPFCQAGAANQALKEATKEINGD